MVTAFATISSHNSGNDLDIYGRHAERNLCGEHSENISKCLGKVSAILSLSKLRSDERIDEERHIYGCYGRHKLLYV